MFYNTSFTNTNFLCFVIFDVINMALLQLKKISLGEAPFVKLVSVKVSESIFERFSQWKVIERIVFIQL